MPTIAIYCAQTNERSKIVGTAMHRGCMALGLRADLLPSASYRGVRQHEVAIFYGLADGLRRVFDDYRRHGKAIYIDLGYWGRRKRTRFDGHHKLVLNSRHPTAYFSRKSHGSARFDALGVTIEPWRAKGRHIIVAGMSGKAAACEGLGVEEWERNAVAKLRGFTDRPIIYRPKPNWTGARAIPGSIMDAKTPLELALRNCHAVVTHHSNVGVDALMAGVPVISVEGVASLLGSRHVSDIGHPAMPDGRHQWAADLAWTQWTVAEMEQGLAMRYLMDEGLI